MKRLKNYIKILFTGILFLSLGFNEEYEKLAQTGFQFLSVVSDARAAAMGEAMTSLQLGSSALFFNPAGMSEQEGILNVSASNNRWISDITHNTFSLAINPFGGKYGIIGFSLQSVDYGEFYGTIYDESSENKYIETGIFKLNALALGLGYARRLTERFSVGGQIRLVRQDLGETIVPEYVSFWDSTGTLVQDTLSRETDNVLKPLAFDFGTQFKTGIKSLVFGMSVRNFSKELKYIEEGFQLPLVFNLGISMNLVDLVEEGKEAEHSLYLSVDASHYRSHAEQIKIGMDYRIKNTLSLRGGYISNNYESKYSFGVGIVYSKVVFDFAYTPFGLFGSVQRMTVRFSL